MGAEKERHHHRQELATEALAAQPEFIEPVTGTQPSMGKARLWRSPQRNCAGPLCPWDCCTQSDCERKPCTCVASPDKTNHSTAVLTPKGARRLPCGCKKPCPEPNGADGEWDRLGSAHGSLPLGELLTSRDWRTEMRSGPPWVGSAQPGPTATHRAAGEGKCAAKKSQDHCWHPSGSVN